MYKDFLIPKKGKGFRRISIPSKGLLKSQRKSLKDLENIIKIHLINTDLISNVHGFMKHKNACTAAIAHTGYNCTIIMDIENFFDNCKKDVIFTLLPILTSLRHFDDFFHKDGHLAQGFATSPILSTVYLTPVLIGIKNQLQQILPDFALTVYADDIQISFNIVDSELKDYTKESSIISIVKTQLELNNFKLKESKTRIRYAKYGFRRILGVNVGEDKLYPTRKLKRKMRAAKHQHNWSSYAGLTTWSKCLLPKVA